MGIRAHVRRRLAIGLAGAVLASALIGGIAPVAADDPDGPDTFEREVNVGRDATGLAAETATLTISGVAAPAAAVGDEVPAAPGLGTPIANWRDDRD